MPITILERAAYEFDIRTEDVNCEDSTANAIYDAIIDEIAAEYKISEQNLRAAIFATTDARLDEICEARLDAIFDLNESP